MTNEHLAKEANRLLSDDVLRLAFERARTEALEELAAVDAAEPVAVLRCQQRVAALDAIRSQLQAMVLGVGNPAPGYYP